ncbi:MAG: hypothetical protein IKN12_05945, partial [Selenomonadaceae bacterium]|nr:hypothetical protein [Selenomonadaceae bacterium]
FFSASRITVASLLVTTNWLFALRILFYLLLVLFTFNLPTTPKNVTLTEHCYSWIKALLLSDDFWQHNQ